MDTEHKHIPTPWPMPPSYEQVKAQRDALLAACKGLLPHAVNLLDISNAIDGIIDSRINVDYDIEQARKAIALCDN